ncbi:LLM class flavin-dependent oxidoreductase [Geodermatophilus sp. DSM 44513]|uniref:LLM class flavin-dependent oxidoreductase n=1 Tax=Geodermatophilus sp. DSM 44513 TaxID=1528104 RepID=UPI0012818724|nr:LLM class flavin-dependent oxidoreductase [Geodermatophilus sp. DSM 44513]WNV76176.1 LLM class flavin-dependent oxidoreductase [Geodermatophilus sp. DSM 44513]
MTAVLLNAARPWAAADAVHAAVRGCAAGLDGVGLVDSPRLFPDPFLETERVLSATDAVLAGPCVASLGLRHPVTVAGAVRTLERHHPGRVLTVVGRGESSVRNEGLPAPPMAAYTAALAALRERLTTADGPVAAGRVLGAASGPRTVAATATALGGVLVDVGVDAGVVARAVRLAREHDPGVAVWLFLRATLTSSAAESAAAAEPVLGSCAMRLAAAPDWYGIPAADVAAVRAAARSHDYARHGTADARGGATTAADSLVRERFVLTGDPGAITARLRPLAGLGVAGVVLAGGVAGVEDRLAELVPALRAGLRTPEDDR